MKLNFHVTGKGEPLILLHGLLGSSHNLLPHAERLAARFRVFAPDHRNHGGSPHSDEMNYDVLAADVLGFMSEHGIVRASVLGHSMGGKTAMHLAQQNPDRVDKLMVVDISPREYPPRFAPVLDAMLSIDLKKCQRRSDVDAALAGVVESKTMRQFLLKNVTSDVSGTLSWKVNLHALRANYDQLRSALPARGCFNGPSLFVSGGRSDYLLEADMELIRRMFPRAELKAIADAGHWVHAEAPEEFIQVVENFLVGTN